MATISPLVFLLAAHAGFAETPVSTPTPTATQSESANADEMRAVDEILLRLQSRSDEFKKDTQDYVLERESQTWKQISESYDLTIRSLEEEQSAIRSLAKARFESFLSKYPKATYAPHVMFRLAELYYEEAEDSWQKEDRAYTALQRNLSPAEYDKLPPPPQKDYSKPLELYERIASDYAGYERIDGVYYMLGYCYFEENSAQRDPSRGEQAFLKLVSGFPESDFSNDANMRLGQNFFDTNETDKAIGYFDRIVAAGEDSRNFDQGLYMLAWSHYRLANLEHFDEYGKALDLFLRLVDHSREMQAARGSKSDMEGEAILYMAISFADIAGFRQKSAVDVAKSYFSEKGQRPYEVDVIKKLSQVLIDQGRLEDAIATLRYLQEAYPLDSDNPKFQRLIARIYMNLDFPDKASPEHMAAAERARMELTEKYNDHSDWWTENRSNPDALSVASGYIEESLAEVAKAFHVQAQQSLNKADFSIAADKYREYLRNFPFAENYYEMEMYLSDAYMNAGRFEEAEKEYLQILKTTNHNYGDSATIRLMDARRQIVVNKYGRLEAHPDNAIVERVVDTPYNAKITVYALTDEHKAFIESADAVLTREFTDPTLIEERKTNLSALTYLPGQILYEFGHYEEARERLFRVVEQFPDKDEGAFAAGLIVSSYQAENDMAKVRLYAGKFRKGLLGETKAAQAGSGKFGTIEEEAAFTMASDLIKQDDRAGAAEAFKAFMADYPESQYIEQAHFNAANNLELIGKVDEANKLFEDYINAYPADKKSEGMYFRIASNYASILELNMAIRYYEQLVKNFPTSVDGPAAIFNAAFLRTGLGDHVGAARNYEYYAEKYPSQGDAELVFYRAREQWEMVGDDEAMSFYRRYLSKYEGVNPDRSLEVQYRIVKLYEKQGKSRQAETEWATLSQFFDAYSARSPIGVLGRRYAAEASFRGVWQQYQAFKQVSYAGKPEKVASMLTEDKASEIKLLKERCEALVARYQDFVYMSAAFYVEASAFFDYADMVFNAPAPPGFNDEQIGIYREVLDGVRMPLEDAGKEIAQFNLQKAKESHAWSEWEGKTLDLLNLRFPSEFPRERVEQGATTKGFAEPSVGPVTITLPSDDQGGQP